MKKFIICGVAAGSMLLSACHGGLLSSAPETATAVLKPTRGNTVAGTISFSPAGDRLRVVAELTGLTPGAHGFHIHEKGDCSAPDASSAGGHFNPAGKRHGHPDLGEHHAGDMPQLIADARGNAKITAFLDAPEVSRIIGLSVIVHADADDFKTQPAGNSGPRQACGVITGK